MNEKMEPHGAITVIHKCILVLLFSEEGGVLHMVGGTWVRVTVWGYLFRHFGDIDEWVSVNDANCIGRHICKK